MLRVIATVGAWVILAGVALGCSGSSGARSDATSTDLGAADLPGIDGFAGPGDDVPATLADVADAVDAAGAGDAHDAAVAPAWVLPPCYRACDRVTACGVAACQGYDWASAGTLFEACFGACDEAWAAEVLAAPGCPEVETAAAQALADYAVACTTDPCQPACVAFAGCVVSACEALDPALEAGIATDCHAWCDPSASVWMQETPCSDLVAALDQGDPTFSTTCHGTPSTCPGAELCEPWSAKVTSCIVAHCAGNADAYQAGIALLLTNLCEHDAKCPAEADVQAGLSPAVTCDTPGFDALGHDEPFTALCDGTLGVAPALVAEACELLAGCPGAEWLGGVTGCSAFLVLTPGAAPRTQCLIDAVDCTGAYACLEGL